MADKQMTVERQTRFMQALGMPDASAGEASPIVDPETRTVEFPFSSEEPVGRWFGDEVLSHKSGAADLSRLNNGAPLLYNHNPDDVIGVVESATVRDGRGYSKVRFAKTARADEIMGMVNDGILRNVSFAYEVGKYETDDAGDPGERREIYTGTAWKAYEVSIVSIPADNTVGVGRAEDGGSNRPVRVERAAATAATTNLVGAILMPEAINPVAAPSVDINAVREAEVARVRAIEGMGAQAQFGLTRDEVASMITSGTSIEAARGIVLEKLSKNGAKPVAGLGANEVDLTAKEKRSYSFLNAVRAMANKDWSGAGFEREVAVELARKQGRELGQGLLVPYNIPFAPDEQHRAASGMQVRAPYSTGAAGTGGTLVATNLLAADFIEVLRNASVTAQLGARYLTGLVGQVDIPRQATQTASYWVGESGVVTDAEATTDKVSLRPKTLGALSTISRLMLLQSTPAIEMMVREDLVRVLALGIDLAVLAGTGASNQPTGIANQAGVVSIVGGTNGANISFDLLIQMIAGTKIANAPQENLGFAFNAKVNGYLQTLKATTNQYLWSPAGYFGGAGAAPMPTVQGQRIAISNQLPYNLTKGTSSGICSQIIYGNWQEVLVGSWGALELLVNPYDSTGFTSGDVKIRALQTVDVQVRHAPSFAVMSDALTPGF